MAPIKARKKQSGVTLIETMISVLLLLVMGAGMTSVFGFCTGINKSQGELATRTTELAQDKMEQLLAISNFNDSTSDTTQFPTAISGGTGLGGSMAPNTTVGGTTKGAPVALYVDYTGPTGASATAATAFFTRQWSISTPVGGANPSTLKTITVVVYAATTAGGAGSAPSTTLVCSKAQ